MACKCACIRVVYDGCIYNVCKNVFNVIHKTNSCRLVHPAYVRTNNKQCISQ